jgi:predicted DCC family thiol-disulfide oxidoreductase YuxK
LEKNLNIIFYDGDCGLCQRSIRFVYKADTKNIFHYAPLNGQTYNKIYGNVKDPLTTIKFFHNQITYQKSLAVFEILKLLGGKYKILLIFKIIPIFICDYVYDKIANRRKLITCILLTKNNQFLN